MSQCLVSLGSNLGDRQRLLRAALAGLAADARTSVLEVSSWLETPPIGGPTGQGGFFNGVALLETSRGPLEMLELAHDVELRLGRMRSVCWDARPIDIDLLLFDALVLATPQLTLPHRWLPVRRFVLQPASEVAPNWTHPVIGWTLAQLARQLDVSPPSFLVVGADVATRAAVAAQWPTVLSLPAEAATTSAVLSCVPQIEWVDWSGCEEMLARRLGAEVADERIPRAILIVSATAGSEARGAIAQVIAAQRCPFVVVDSASPTDRTREIVGAVLATLPFSALNHPARSRSN